MLNGITIEKWSFSLYDLEKLGLQNQPWRLTCWAQRIFQIRDTDSSIQLISASKMFFYVCLWCFRVLWTPSIKSICEIWGSPNQAVEISKPSLRFELFFHITITLTHHKRPVHSFPQNPTSAHSKILWCFPSVGLFTSKNVIFQNWSWAKTQVPWWTPTMLFFIDGHFPQNGVSWGLIHHHFMFENGVYP